MLPATCHRQHGDHQHGRADHAPADQFDGVECVEVAPVERQCAPDQVGGDPSNDTALLLVGVHQGDATNERRPSTALGWSTLRRVRGGARPAEAAPEKSHGHRRRSGSADCGGRGRVLVARQLRNAVSRAAWRRSRSAVGRRRRSCSQRWPTCRLPWEATPCSRSTNGSPPTATRIATPGLLDVAAAAAGPTIHLMPVTAADLDVGVAGVRRRAARHGSTSSTSGSATTATPRRGRPATR